jgi:hypothetical protein
MIILKVEYFESSRSINQVVHIHYPICFYEIRILKKNLIVINHDSKIIIFSTFAAFIELMSLHFPEWNDVKKIKSKKIKNWLKRL